jgi:hypothetical protein
MEQPKAGTDEIGYKQLRKRAWRNLAYFIGQSGYGDGEEFTLDDLSDRLAELSGVPGRFRAGTIERYLRRYFERHLESPLLRAEEPDQWRLNEMLYRARPPPAELPRGRPRKQKLDLSDGPVEPGSAESRAWENTDDSESGE